MQTTILNPVSCYGIGVHSGERTQLTLKPAKVNTGIVFVRTDIKSGDNFIFASYTNVSDTSLSTSLKNTNNISVSTVEHLMAALWGCRIDNIITRNCPILRTNSSIHPNFVIANIPFSTPLHIT